MDLAPTDRVYTKLNGLQLQKEDVVRCQWNEYQPHRIEHFFE